MDHFHIALSEDQLRAVSSIGLAHVGDAVYELLVRTWLCAHGKATGKDLHRAAIALVCAPEQSRRAQRILPLLTAEEETVFKRGRNAAVHAIPKNGAIPDKHRDMICLLASLPASMKIDVLLRRVAFQAVVGKIHDRGAAIF